MTDSRAPRPAPEGPVVAGSASGKPVRPRRRAAGALALVVAVGALACGVVVPAAAAPRDDVSEAAGAAGSVGVTVTGEDAALAGAQAAATVPARLRQALYVDTDTQARTAAAQARAQGRTGVAAKLDVIAKAPQARWIGDWYTIDATRSVVASYVKKARAAKRTPQIVLYAIPGRDCGSHSAGGLTEKTYPQWIAQVARGLRDGAVGGASQALVVLEPDSLMMDCGDAAADARRDRLLKNATATLAATGAWVYLDAGHSNWRSPADTASRLRAAGVAKARGFATNVSNYNRTSAEQAYGKKVAQALAASGVPAAHRHFVIDTSRNGKASAAGQWCNPRGQGLGPRPKPLRSGFGLDALLWVKHPGESDGSCNGGPGAGQWWEEIALELVANRVR